MGSILASGGSLTYPFMVGEVSQSLDEIEGLSQAEKDDIAAVGGAVMAALENLGIGKLLPKGTSNKIIGGIAKGLITEGTTEGMQELVLIGSEAVAGKQFGEGEILNRLKESAAAGAVVGGSFKGGLTTGAKVKSLFTSDGNLISEGDLSNLPEAEKFAAADVARLLDETAKENGLNLKDINPSSSKGSRQALENARGSTVQKINDLKDVLKKRLDKKNASSLEELLSVYSEAAAGIASGKKKVSETVSEKQIQAIQQLVGDTREGQQLVQELVKSNVITNLFKDGMKGGVSQFTDLFNPISHNGAVYDPKRYFNVLVSGFSGVTLGVPTTAAIYSSGRVVDFFTGRRSKIAKFVNSNKKALGLPAPEGTSLIEQKNKQKAAAKDRRAAIAQIATILDAPKAGFVENILLGTGLDRSGLETVLNNMASDFGSNPDFVAILDDIQKNLDGEGVEYLDNVSEIIPVIGAYAQAYSPELVTNTPDNPLLKRSFDSPNVQTDMPTMGGGGANTDTSPQFGTPQFTTQENYNRGIQANRQAAETLSQQAQNDPELDLKDKAVVASALDQLQFNLGSEPTINAQAIFEQAKENVNEDVAVKYIKPYVDRVVRQQRSNPVQAAPEAGVTPNVDTALEKLRKAQGDIKEATQDTNYDQALKIVNEERKASPSYLQRKLGIKRSEAVALIERLEAEGIVSAANHVGKRTINEEALNNAVNQDPDSKLSQTLDLQSLSPKKPQAPTLEASEIPTETRKAYKLMKVQPSRPNELLPLYAKDGEDGKGSPSGFQLNTWHKAEMQRPMIGGKLLAKRAGIHALNLPVFDQGKAKVKGEQRVWVEVEIPAISQDTQLESDNSPLINNNIREGIKNRLIGTKESYDYKTNPNASNDAGGWPIAGSMRALRIVPDNEIAQILRDNGLDHQIDNSFTDVNEAKAKELMGTPEAETDLLSQQSPILTDRAIGSENTISTRFPTQVASQEDPIKDRLIVDTESMKATPAAFEHNMDLVTEYVNFPTADVQNKDPDAIADTFKEHIISNLLFLHDQVPQEIRDRSKKWYDGARKITTKWSEKYNVPDTGIAGALAALSPQKDWYQNVSLAERVLDVMTGKMDTLWTETMNETAAKIFGKPHYAEDLVEIQGKTLKDVMDMNDDHLAAMWIRTFDEAHNDRRYRTVSSEGDFIGEPSGVAAWGSLSEIGKAVAVIRNPSYENVSLQMGARHKVRNFYNNIISPNNNKGDVTIDTHAVAAALLRALSGSSVEVVHNFGTSMPKAKQPEGYRAAKASGIMGSQGLYGLYADAYREAAAQRGIKPRELQSITWEAVRGLFPAKWKQKKNVESVNNVWSKYKNGDITLDQARKQILDLAGGIDDPTWYDRSNGTKDVETRDSSYEGELDRPSVAGDARGMDSGTRGGDTVLSQGILGELVGTPTQREFDFGRTLPTNQEFKSQTELANVPFEVGKKGGKFENGFKDYINLKRLADAYMIKLIAYNNHADMVKGSKNAGDSTRGLFNKKDRAAKYLMAGTEMPDGEGVGANSAFITAIHELAHGIASADPEGYAGGIGAGMRSDYRKPVKRFNYLNMRNDETYTGTFEDEIAKLLDIPDAQKQEVISEINLQDNVKYLFEGGGEIEVRDLQKSKDFVVKMSESLDNPVEQEAYLREMAPLIAQHQQYVRGVYEMSVEPIIYYLYNPKAFKKLAPKSAKLVQKFFKESSIIRFYNHPLALGAAVVLAMMMKQEQAEEEDQQRGILNPRQAMQAGALTI